MFFKLRLLLLHYRPFLLVSLLFTGMFILFRVAFPIAFLGKIFLFGGYLFWNRFLGEKLDLFFYHNLGISKAMLYGTTLFLDFLITGGCYLIVAR